MAQLETVSPCDVKEGDILLLEGFRVKATDLKPHEPTDSQYYTVSSAPNDEYPDPLPPPTEGALAGGKRETEATRFVGET